MITHDSDPTFKILVIKSRRKPHTLVYEDLFYVVCFKNGCSVFLMFVGRFVKFVRTENNLVAYVFKILCLFRIRIRVSKMLCPDLDRIKSNLYPEQCNADIWHSSIKFFLQIKIKGQYLLVTFCFKNILKYIQSLTQKSRIRSLLSCW